MAECVKHKGVAPTHVGYLRRDARLELIVEIAVGRLHVGQRPTQHAAGQVGVLLEAAEARERDDIPPDKVNRPQRLREPKLSNRSVRRRLRPDKSASAEEEKLKFIGPLSPIKSPNPARPIIMNCEL